MSTASRLPRMLAFAATALAALSLAACSSGGGSRQVKTGSVSVATVSLMSQMDMPRNAPIMIRVFKEEAQLEVWKQERSGQYGLLRTYPICRFSGVLGPKINEGDRQAPEGFYDITTKNLNPWSRNHLAFNIGFPNAFDRQLGRTGNHIMVHGGCKSVGCYAMSNQRIEEIYGLVREALANGQESVPFHAYPFRLTAENLRRHGDDPNVEFWANLKQGYDIFARTKRPPLVAACNGRYGFSAGGGGGDMCSQSAAPSATAYQSRAAYRQPEPSYSADYSRGGGGERMAPAPDRYDPAADDAGGADQSGQADE